MEDLGLPVVDVATYTGFPEMLEGRVKTLHPRIFGGILARHDREDDRESLRQHSISIFELVVVNLYPFAATIARPEFRDSEAIEQIDIGGPSLIRAAAKNHAFTTVLTDPGQYTELREALATGEGTTLCQRRHWAGAAFEHTATYDRVIADYFQRGGSTDFPRRLTRSWTLREELRYGENPHQRAALYEEEPPIPGSLLAATQRHGKELSYNNYLDLDAAHRLVRDFATPTAVVIKHNNPCGIGSGQSLAEALDRALAGDPVSAFGSIVGLNRSVDRATAEVLTRPDQFIEAILAPAFDSTAFEILTTRPKWKQNVRLMESHPVGATQVPTPAQPALRQIDGGLLCQDADTLASFAAWQCVTKRTPSPRERSDLEFVWRVVRHVRSN
ncbi:MAG TPA: bifunctional phosphoribosylaminoimidazolecarboxamide formyltransferase/IMP cyclohydrolase, partial [Pirellulaceae bacterium]